MCNRSVSVAGMLTVCGVVVLIVSLACRASEQERFELNTTSPDGTYRALFKEQVSVPGPLHHEVQFDVLKGDLRIVKDELLYKGGAYDSRFPELFPEHRWISSSVLRFGGKDNLPEAQHDEISIENATDRTLTYLRVNDGKYEVFLLFELQPRSFVTLYVQPQTDEGQDLSYIGCKGRFDDGTSIAEVAGNFRVRGRYHGRSHYSVKISDKGVQITSKELESI